MKEMSGKKYIQYFTTHSFSSPSFFPFMASRLHAYVLFSLKRQRLLTNLGGAYLEQERKKEKKHSKQKTPATLSKSYTGKIF